MVEGARAGGDRRWGLLPMDEHLYVSPGEGGIRFHWMTVRVDGRWTTDTIAYRRREPHWVRPRTRFWIVAAWRAWRGNRKLGRLYDLVDADPSPRPVDVTKAGH